MWYCRQPGSARAMLLHSIWEIRMRHIRGNIGPLVISVNIIGLLSPTPASMYTAQIKRSSIFYFEYQRKFMNSLCSPCALPHIVGAGLPPDTKNWSVLQTWFNCSGPDIEKCSISKRIWQIFEFNFKIVNWQLPVPSYCTEQSNNQFI